jgi:site-specific DNA-methyltransferase (adenine-specific)
MTYSELHHGDCLEKLKTLETGSVDLFYIDPPFFTQKVHALTTRDGSVRYSFKDIWSSRDEYGDFLLERLNVCFRSLKETGSLFFHCDDNSAHIAKIVLDGIFGGANFQSEIIWSYRRWSNSRKGLIPSHQTILFYSRSSSFKFNTLTVPYSESTNLDQILQKRSRDDRGKAVYAKDENGALISNGAKRGVPLGDVWDIPYLNPKAKERVGYPTQKPLLLLERIIEISTDPGDLVVDPFCGSGTTLVAAKLLGRKSLGIDISEDALRLAEQRLGDPVRSSSQLMTVGRESYIRPDIEILEFLKGLSLHAVHRNKGIDAILASDSKGKPVCVRIQRPGETTLDAARSLAKAAARKGGARLILVVTNPSRDLLGESSLPREVTLVYSTAVAVQNALATPNEVADAVHAGT